MKDPLYNEAWRIISEADQGSVSLIQRRLVLGYNRAGKIMDQLERDGIVSPFNGINSREVLKNFYDLTK
jgi:S-DNA-T family DNA segregation ATPase FtsK/SpoIIIE